jgi:hypothetical protein
MMATLWIVQKVPGEPIRFVARRPIGEVKQQEESGTDKQKMHQRLTP